MKERLDIDAVVALFHRWIEGDSHAMDDLVRVMTPVLWHTVRAYGLSTPQAEDAIQTTWLALVREHRRISSPEAVVAWLVTTARREAWRAVRRDGRSIDTDDIEVHLPHESSAESEATANLERGRLWAAVATLDDRCRRLLRIVAFSRRPDYRRIANDLDMAVGSIGPTRRRCLAKLRKQIEQGDDEGR